MRSFINPTIEDIKPSGIRKFFDIAAEMDDVISLGVGEPDFDTPWNIREAAIHTLNLGKTVYTANAGLKELRQEIAAYSARKYRLNYDPLKEILVTVGGSEAIDLALRVSLVPGDEVLIPDPSYVAYIPCTRMAGGTPISVPLFAENSFKVRRSELEKVCTDKTKALIFPFPNNPTGGVMTEEDMLEVRDFCVEHDILVISDEIYAELTYGKKPHVSIASLPGMRERTVVINGFSKAFSMTGWRLGYAMGPEYILRQMIKLHQFAIMCAPTTSQYAAVEALRHCDEDVQEMRDEYNRRRRYVVKRFNDIGLPCPNPEGAFYVFPDIRSLGLSSDDFCQDLLQKKHVAVVPGTAFGNYGEGFVRVSYAYSLDELRSALDRIEEYVNELRNSSAEA